MPLLRTLSQFGHQWSVSLYLSKNVYKTNTQIQWDAYGYGSIPINTIFSGMNIHKSQLFWCSPGVQSGRRLVWQHYGGWKLSGDMAGALWDVRQALGKCGNSSLDAQKKHGMAYIREKQLKHHETSLFLFIFHGRMADADQEMWIQKMKNRPWRWNYLVFTYLKWSRLPSSGVERCGQISGQNCFFKVVNFNRTHDDPNL